MSLQPTPLIAAIRYSPTDPIEALMVQAARVLEDQGVRLGGVLQHDNCDRFDDPCAMELEDLTSGERYPLSQELGAGSEACRLDPASLARAAVSIRAAIDCGAELIVINKFGVQEAAGAGLRDEMGHAVVAGIPLLTAIADRFVDDWQVFTGGDAALLEPDLAHILNWWAGVRA